MAGLQHPSGGVISAPDWQVLKEARAGKTLFSQPEWRDGGERAKCPWLCPVGKDVAALGAWERALGCGLRAPALCTQVPCSAGCS